MSTDAVTIEKRKVAESFGRAAGNYDKAAHFQRDVGHRLMQLLPEGDYATVIDLGCGTGYFTPVLGRHLNTEQLIGIDLSEGMISFARKQREGEWAGKTITWAVGDAESLPLETGTVDIIFSSLAVQWCDSYKTLFAELYRVLKPGGRVIFSTLLDGTLRELEASWREVDNYRHVNSFVNYPEIEVAAGLTGFEMVESQQYVEVLQYDSVKELTRELKMLGAHNVNEGRSLNVTGRERIVRFKQAYERFRTSEGWLPATYEVLLAVLRKPQASSIF